MESIKELRGKREGGGVRGTRSWFSRKGFGASIVVGKREREREKKNRTGVMEQYYF